MPDILHVIRSANPASGGPIEAVIRLGIEHRRSGRQVEIVTLDAPDAPWLADMPFPVHALGPVSTKYGYSRRLAPWLRRHAPTFDVVIVNGLWQYTSFAVWRAVRSTSTPYVVFPHGMLDPWFKRRYPLKHLKKWLYWPWAEYRVLRDASAVLFTSDEERRLASESFWLYQSREKVITYGTGAPPAQTPRQRELLFEAFPSLAGKRLMLFLGRIHEKKGCDLLIRAFAAATRGAAASSAPWQLVLGGPVVTDRYRRFLERLIAELGIEDRVTWAGMLTGDLKWAAFRAADVFVLPSHQENFGVAVAEALACGVPVLISDKVNIWREIVADEAGLAEADDQRGTDALLARWMALDPAVQNRMRANAARCFAARFNARDSAARIAALVEQLCASKGRPAVAGA
jgi:glycosyltransferase involved in cell wall biosynthesis